MKGKQVGDAESEVKCTCSMQRRRQKRKKKFEQNVINTSSRIDPEVENGGADVQRGEMEEAGGVGGVGGGALRKKEVGAEEAIAG